MFTPELIKELAPRAHASYIKALSGDAGWQTLARYKITSSEAALSGFLANCMHETGGLIILRESLNYKTPARLRQVWPSRFGSKGDAELLKLCGNEKALASIVYNGRMGNRPGTDDGFNFRGAGYLQTTGRDSFIKYGKLVGIDFSKDPPPSTDDAEALLVMSAAEWASGRCNELCEAGNFSGACAVINVGSASKISAVVGMADRQKWYKHISGVFGDYDGVLDAPGAVATVAPPAPGAPEAKPQQAPSPGAGSASSKPQGNDSYSVLYEEFERWLKGGGGAPAKRSPGLVRRATRSVRSPADLPAVILHPELADLGGESGDPTYRHRTELIAD